MEVLVQKFFIQPYLYLQINFLSLVPLFPFSSQNISWIKNSVICHLYTFKYQIFHKLKKIRQKLSCSNVAFHKGLTNYKFIDSVKRECIVAITRKRERDARGSEEHGWGHKTRILRFLRGLSSMRCISRCIRLSVLHTYLIHSSHPRSAVRLHRVSVGSTTSEET